MPSQWNRGWKMHFQKIIFSQNTTYSLVILESLVLVFRIIVVCINVVIFQQRVPVLEPGPEQPDPRLHGAGAGWACLARHHRHAPARLLPPPPAAAPPHGRRPLPAGLRGRQQGLGSSQNWRWIHNYIYFSNWIIQPSFAFSIFSVYKYRLINCCNIKIFLNFRKYFCH